MRRGFWILPLLLIIVASAVVAAQVDAVLGSLRPTGYVSDYANVAGARRESIETLLGELEQKTGAQVAVVTLASTEGADMADFAVRLFERWGIGQAEEDNGVLLIAAIEDRDVRIEVGYGLEPVITDAMAGRILDQSVIPYFADGDYAAGLQGGATAIAALIAEDAGVELAGMPEAPPPIRDRDGSPVGGILRLLFILAVIVVFWRNPWLAMLLLSNRHGGFGGGGGFGRGSGGGFGGFGGGMSGGGGAGRSW